MIEPHPDLTSSVIFGLGWLYLILFSMNAAWTLRTFRQNSHFRMPDVSGGQEVPSAAVWAIYTGMLLMVCLAHFTGYNNPQTFMLRMPDWFKDGFDQILGNSKKGPVLYFFTTVVLFALVLKFREWLVKPTVGWCLLNASLLFLTLSMTDYDFRQIVGKPDNVPIVSMLFIVGFFTWLYLYKAVENDKRRAEGRPVVEAEANEKVLVWPDLVYTELICMVVLTAILILWGIALQAPLEEPASAAKTPNPSKAPWYFLGLQEMLVYYDPWLAGVVFPSVIVVGLMAIPYIDFNKAGNGYYIFKERAFAVSTFILGFLPLWVAMIVLGTFLRGPNWNIFGIYEFWDVHKLEALTNINLSEYFWLKLLHQPLPGYSPGDSETTKTLTILLREAPGFAATFVYLFALPPLLAATIFRPFFNRMGFIRYMVFVNLALMMAALPLKMLLRWSLNLKYIVAIPEWFFNI